MDVPGLRVPEGTSTLMDRPERVGEVSARDFWGEVTAGMEKGVEGEQQAQGSVQREA